MNKVLLRYGGNWFLGVVKFYDSKKDFGYIGSNNKGISTTKGFHDFYFNRSSFQEGELIKELTLVVFQVVQENGRTRAANARNFKKDADDIKLLLSYHGVNEEIRTKDRTLTFLNLVSIPGDDILNREIELFSGNFPDRTPETVLSRMKWLFNLFKISSNLDEKFIFDRDFKRPRKELWQSLFSNLTIEEKVAALSSFPSICCYLEEPDVDSWLNALTEDKLKLILYIQRVVRAYGYNSIRPLSLSKYKEELGVIRREALNQILLKAENCEYEKFYAFQCALTPFEDILTCEDESKIQKLHEQFKIAEFKTTVDNWDSSKYSPSEVTAQFMQLPESLKAEGLSILEPLIKNRLTDALDKRMYLQGMYWSHEFNDICPGICSEANRQIIEQLKKFGEDCFKEGNAKELFDILDSMRQREYDTERNLILAHMQPYFLKEDSLLSVKQYISNEYISRESAREIAKSIIKDLTPDEITSLDRWGGWKSLDDRIISEMLVEKGISFIKGHPSLSAPFFSDIQYQDTNSIIRDNCLYLSHLKNLCEDRDSNAWNSYIESLGKEDRLILYTNEIVEYLSDENLFDIVNEITEADIEFYNRRWYSCPKPKYTERMRVLLKDSNDTFPAIAKRLINMEINSSSIKLVVFLTEFLAEDRPPEDEDYYLKREWSDKFKSRIDELKSKSSSKLGALLWLIHNSPGAKSSALFEIFPYLPPYLQIKSVRKLFLAKAKGLMQFTASSLYDLLGGASSRMCLPLEIIFAYLKMREEGNEEYLNNNHMLRLISDREDADEWGYIRLLMTPCKDRWLVNYKANEGSGYGYDFGNGIASEHGSCILLKNTRKMVSNSGEFQNRYNNKYFSDIEEYIAIAFENSSYTREVGQNCVTYTFPESEKPEIMNLCRNFNVIFNNKLLSKGLTTKSEVGESFCECRLANQLLIETGQPFYWCDNKPCSRPPVIFKTTSQWEQYTLLDFMRILGINPNRISKSSDKVKFGHYISLSSFFLNFVKFYDHLKCRSCGKLMKPHDITNFTSKAITEFSCHTEGCECYGRVVYLNHCFNRLKCNATIDSRDSKKCPEDQYICPECGACCSTQNFRNRIMNLQMNGGKVSQGLLRFVQEDRGHWEKGEFYCYKCGALTKNKVCPNCGAVYAKDK